MIKQSIIVSIILCLMAGCSSNRPPVLYASGYIADDGVMRIWQKVSGNDRPMLMMSVYTPYSGNTIITHYEYSNGELSSVRSDVQSKDGEQVRLRLDEKGNPNFMERVLPDRNEPLSSDDILRIKYEEHKVRDTSTTLAAGKIELFQGHIRNGIITTCAGEEAKLKFSAPQQAWLEKRVRNGGNLSLAWLNAPRGLELLLVANDDFCQWQPTLENF